MALDLAALMQRKARLDSEIAQAKKQESAAARKADSKRKIVLGAVVLAAVRKGGMSENSVRGLIDRYASDRDKAVFENFAFETASAETATSESITTNDRTGGPRGGG